ncbi:MAG: hypothetical protein IH851_11955 [Armatimonadetes bacterium]|nr:hypothetical protein [Armatimonadota bacterium]
MPLHVLVQRLHAGKEQLSMRRRQRHMARYRHYLNFAPPGATVFLTTTILDFVRVFSRLELADVAAGGLLDGISFMLNLRRNEGPASRMPTPE